MLIEYIRDGLVEEFHEGICYRFLDKNPEDTQPYYLRSCAKPLQATLLNECAPDLTEEELALCCGSHAGEECHIKIARQILDKYNIDEKLLKCGVHAPLSRSMQDKMLLDNEKASEIHNNCSGKHIGFLVVCKKHGWDMNTYDDPNHPLQIAVKKRINSLCEVTKDYPITTDGCGVPILSMPLYNMLIGYINLLKYDKIINAIKNYPYIFGGENRLDTEIIEKSDDLIAKVGAGGLCIVLNIKKKDAFIIKINDCSMEARRFAVLNYINELGWANIPFDNDIKTIQGKIVGKVFIKS